MNFNSVVIAEHRLNEWIVNASPIPCWVAGMYGRWRCRGAAALYRSAFLGGSVSPTRFIASFLQRGDVYVDVGCANGEMCCVAIGATWPTGRAYGFDGREEAVEFVQRMIARYDFGNVGVEHVLVGADCGVSSFVIDLDHPTSSSRTKGWVQARSESARTKTVELPVVSLDVWVEQHGVSRLDLLKIDVEGAELDVIRGCLEVLALYRPVIVMEVCSPVGLDRAAARAQVWSSLVKIGYTEWDAICPGGLRRIGSLQEIERGVHDVVVAHHDSLRYAQLRARLAVA